MDATGADRLSEEGTAEDGQGVVQRGQEQDRRVAARRIGLDGAAQLVARAARQHDVGQDEVEGPRAHELMQSLLSCGIGLVIGIPLAYLAGRLLSDRLFGVGSFDLPVVTISVLLLSLSAAAAALLPARRAASIEPMHALRSE